MWIEPRSSLNPHRRPSAPADETLFLALRHSPSSAALRRLQPDSRFLSRALIFFNASRCCHLALRLPLRTVNLIPMSTTVNIPRLLSDSEKRPFAEAGQAEGGQASSSQASTVEKVPSSGQISQEHHGPQPRRSDVGTVLARHSSVRDADSLASIDRPPSEEEELPPSKIYKPLSFPVIALLMPASIFGVLARLGLQAITTYDGKEIFPLAWVQGIGCLIMGFALGLKEPIGQL